jgi:hypothetical protein
MFVAWVGVSGDPKENKGDIFIVATKGGCSAGGVGMIPVAERKNLKPATTHTVVVYSMPVLVDKTPKQESVVTFADSPF